MGEVIQSHNPPDQTTTTGNWTDSTRIAIPENVVCSVLLSVVATSDDRTKKASWETVFVAARGTGDVSVQQGLIQVLGVQKDLAAALWDVELMEDGADIVVRVKGTNGITVHWGINGQLFGCQIPQE